MVRRENKLDQIDVKLAAIVETQIRQQENLKALTRTVEEHVKRSNLLEDRQAPLEKHVQMVDGALKTLGILLMLFPIFEFIWRRFHNG